MRFSIEFFPTSFDRKTPLTVLIVDADPQVCQDFETLIHDLGHYAVSAQSIAAAEALTLAFCFDVAVCNLQMTEGCQRLLLSPRSVSNGAFAASRIARVCQYDRATLQALFDGDGPQPN